MSRKRIGEVSECEVNVLHRKTANQPTEQSRNQERTAPSRENTPVTEASIIVHEMDGDGVYSYREEYRRSTGIIFRAMRLLEEWKYLPAQISHSRIPVDIIALRHDLALLIQVIYARKPVSSARVLISHFAEKVENLRRMGTTRQFRKIIMVYSRLYGWKYYEVLPGGLIPAWALPAVPEA